MKALSIAVLIFMASLTVNAENQNQDSYIRHADDTFQQKGEEAATGSPVILGILWSSDAELCYVSGKINVAQQYLDQIMQGHGYGNATIDDNKTIDAWLAVNLKGSEIELFKTLKECPADIQ